MTQLRQRMVNDMTVRGLAENTKKSYLNSVSGLAHRVGDECEERQHQPAPPMGAGCRVRLLQYEEIWGRTVSRPCPAGKDL